MIPSLNTVTDGLPQLLPSLNSEEDVQMTLPLSDNVASLGPLAVSISDDNGDNFVDRLLATPVEIGPPATPGATLSCFASPVVVEGQSMPEVGDVGVPVVSMVDACTQTDRECFVGFCFKFF